MEVLDGTDQWMRKTSSTLRPIEEKLTSFGYAMSELQIGRFEVTFSPSFSAASRVFIADWELLRFIKHHLADSLSPQTRRLMNDRLQRELGHYAFCVLNERDGLIDIPPAPVLKASVVVNASVLPAEAVEVLTDTRHLQTEIFSRMAPHSRGAFSMASMNHEATADNDLTPFATEIFDLLSINSQAASNVYMDLCDTALSMPVQTTAIKARLSLPIFAVTLGLWHVRSPPPKTTRELRREIAHALNVQDAVNQYHTSSAVQDAADVSITTPHKRLVPPLISSNQSENFIFVQQGETATHIQTNACHDEVNALEHYIDQAEIH